MFTDFDKLLDEYNEVQRILETPCSDIPELIQERGSELAVRLSRSVVMLADAKYILNERKETELLKILDEINKHKYSSKIQNALLDSICKKEKYLVDLLERQNAAITHNIDWCRTLMSNARAEMQMTGFQK